MKRKSAQHHSHSNTYGFALFMGALIVLLITAGLAIKLFLLFQQSSFDGKQQFSLEIQEPKQTRFVVFNPSDDSIHMLLLTGKVPDNPELTLGIPVDARIVSTQDIDSPDALGKGLIFNRKELHATPTIIDGINLFIFSHTAHDDKALSQQAVLNGADQDTLFTKIFTDEAIFQEGKSISIVNGTGISGLGSKVQQLLAHIGANVISVTTADTPSPKSAIRYTGDTSYTVSRISGILHIPTIHLSTASISDITVVLGRDAMSQLTK